MNIKHKPQIRNSKSQIGSNIQTPKSYELEFVILFGIWCLFLEILPI